MVHLLTASRYGIFRDELYYIACARHLGAGYVDHPPLIAWITWVVLHTLGLSLLALRLLPALASGLLVWMTAMMAREWGGGGYAQFLAALAIVPVPVYLILQHWLTMNAFEPLCWTGILWAASRITLRRDPRYWIVVGVLVGLSLENKYSIVFLVASLTLGFLFTKERRWLKSSYFLGALAIAMLLFLPNLVWLARHGFPFLEFERHSRESDSRILRGPVSFLLDQARIMNPVLAPLWVAGLAWFFTRRGKALRCIGIAVLVVILILLVMQAKNYYVSPIYPVLFAGGAIAVERWFMQRNWLRVAYPVAILISGCIVAPLVMPILPIPQFLAYHRLWRGFTPVVFENEPERPLPQYFADEFGWEAMAQTTAQVFHQLSPQEQVKTAIFANNYGEAAAIDFFGPRYGLPLSISKAQTYWLWGRRQYDGQSVIVLGSDGRGDREFFRSVEPVARVQSLYSRADERFTIFYGRDMHPPLGVLWPQIKAW
ncbi:glycosyltransferase family 39 protein [Granulicella sp. dw_53]|uniref:glycosyltransferase family 39 protein n=1 Tax=Granulicella sp. dw_53 TaxID=2719792 RepID=UPI001BD273EF|nr:glycosyltransferase family 39 protein [Granulicella sp. dw_53]